MNFILIGLIRHRKPVFNLEISLKNENYYRVDQQKVELFDKDGKLLTKLLL